MSILDNLKKTIGGKDDKKKKTEKAAGRDKKIVKEETKEIKETAVEKIKKAEKIKKEVKAVKKEKKEIEKKKKSKSIFGKKKKIDKEDIPAEQYNVLREPHLTERATDLMKENKYVFKIASDANKIQVKKAVENLYGVSVAKVNVINIPRKRIRYGRGFGFKTGYRKAIVTLKEGERMEVAEGV